MRRLLLLLLLLPLASCGGSEDPPASEPAALASASAPTPVALPSTTASSDPTPGWKVQRKGHADLDGDGIQEEIGYGGELGPIRFVTTLSTTGELATTTMASHFAGWWADGYADLDGDGDQEIVLTREGSSQRPVLVDLTNDGRFSVVDRRDHRPLVYGPSAGPAEGTAYDNDYVVHRGRLVSYRSVDAFPLSSHFFDLADSYEVRVWSWSLDEGRLRATDEGVQCRDRRNAYPAPC